MARINIEESWWSDPRHTLLAKKLGGSALATGTYFTAVRVAQTFWSKPERLIPLKIWETIENSADLVACDLAEVTPEGVYVRGSERGFGWIKGVKERGKLGGLAKASKSKQKLANSSKSYQKLAKPSKGYLLTLTPTLTPTLTLPPAHVLDSDSGSDSKTGTTLADARVGEAVADSPISGTKEFIARYVEAYQRRYGPTARPALTGKVLGQIKRLLADVGLARACDLIETYCGMADQWFLTKAHDFGTFVENQSKVGLALDTGKTMGRKEAQNAEATSYYQNQLARFEEDQNGW